MTPGQSPADGVTHVRWRTTLARPRTSSISATFASLSAPVFGSVVFSITVPKLIVRCGCAAAAGGAASAVSGW